MIDEAVVAELPGLIFTLVWALDDPADRGYVDELTEPVRAGGGRMEISEQVSAERRSMA